MNILIAPNSFKNFASSQEISAWLLEGMSPLLPEASIRLHPITDGGENTIATLVEASGGSLLNGKAHDLFFDLVNTDIGMLTNPKKTAVIEIVQTCGSMRLAGREKNPLISTSYGVGEMISQAMDHECESILIGLGGALTCDGGMGAAQALGIQFRDAQGTLLKPIGNQGFNAQSLLMIDDIDMSQCDKRIQNHDFTLVADVKAPLLGPQGQARMFGAQKGATPAQIDFIEESLSHWNDVLTKTFGRSFNVESTACGGGSGSGLTAFLEGKFRMGSDVVFEYANFEDQLNWADVVITGEGKFDQTSLLGKAPFVVAEKAKLKGKYVVGVFGLLGEGMVDDHPYFDSIFQINELNRNAEPIIQCGKKVGDHLYEKKN